MPLPRAPHPRQSCAYQQQPHALIDTLRLQARYCEVSRESRSVWRRVLGHHTTLRNPRDAATPMLQVTYTLEASNECRM